MRLYIYFIAFVLFCLSCSPVMAMEEYKTFKDNFRSYSLAYPAQWRSNENVETREALLRSKTGETLTVMTVESYISPKATIETMSSLDIAELTSGFIDELRIYLPDKVKDITVNEHGLTTVGTEKAVYISVAADWEKGERFPQTKHLLCFLLHKGDLYIMITSAPTENYDKIKNVFQKSFDSFRFLY